MDIKEKYDRYKCSFHADMKLKAFLDSDFVLNNESIYEIIDSINNKYRGALSLTSEEKEKLVRIISDIYCVYQEEGAALLGDDMHDYQWYDNLLSQKDYTENYWNRYKDYLINESHLSPTVLDVLENKTLRSIMSFLEDPKSSYSFSKRGLVIGDVQSGKTSNYIGLICKAADSGYKVIIVLTGTIEKLRKQTQTRIEEGFIGYDPTNATDVGVGRGNRIPKSFTNRLKDFTGSSDQNTTFTINDNYDDKLVFVIKKNVPVLKKVYTSLKNINTHREGELINCPILVVDDEADNASINTNKEDEDPTKINEWIRKILKLFTKSSYVGFTATPFANVFINYYSDDEMLGNDLFPKDFIYALYPPSNYCGSEKYFFNKNDNVSFIKDSNDEIFPLTHKKEWNGEYLFGSVYESINAFIIANALRDIRDIDKHTHRSMLINMSRFTRVQGKIKNIVDDYFKNIKNATRLYCKMDCNKALENEYILKLKETYDKEYSFIEDKRCWEEIFPVLYDAIKDIKIVVVNSSKQSEKLDYDEHKKKGLRVIAIGGLSLSRGLTLEGLMVSYFYRNTKTYDVLMQMGRWFGYRDGYEDLCKIYITEEAASNYKEICENINYFKEDVKTMNKQNKLPKDYGIKIRNESDLQITAPNKMRNAKGKAVIKSFYGNLFETAYLHNDVDIINDNVNKTISFISSFKINQKDINVLHPYFRNVDKQNVVDFLEKIEVHEANDRFDKKQILDFLKKDDKLEYFDVLIMGGNSKITFDNEKLNIHTNIVERKFDISDNGVDSVIRISGQSAHLWGRMDTKNGLTDEQTKNILKKAPAQEYLIEERNPLLIIYFISLKNTIENHEDDELFTKEGSLYDFIKLHIQQYDKNLKYAVGYSIGFPKRSGKYSKAEFYKVNKTANYFDNEHDEGEDGNE